jgi:di/tricarboxylate transporter
MVENRVDDSIKDISDMFDGRFLSRNAAKDGNLSFRIAHVNERLSYVLASASRWPMGAGFIHEESVAAQNMGFLVGVLSPFTGRVIQVDTGDIAWSVVIIKTGLGGLALLLAFLVASFRAVGGTDNAYAVIFRGGLIYYLVTSFFSNNFVSPNIMLPLMLFLALALRAQAAPAEERQPAARGQTAGRTGSLTPVGRPTAARLEQP